MSECTHDCSTCGENCAERSAESFRKALNPESSVKKVIAVVSGKGGVGGHMAETDKKRNNTKVCN